MSASSRIPPRFVPTLTDVVPVDAAQAQPARAAEPVMEPAQASSPVPDDVAAWASEGMLAPRRGVVSLPASLPPLPEGLEPQQPPPVAEVSPQEIFSRRESFAMEYLPPSAPPVQVQLAQETSQAQPVSVEPETVAQEVAVVPAGPPQVQSAVSATEALESIWDTHAQQVTEEYLVHRLMQRVDLVLDQRLREAIATVVQQQTRSIVVRLREEVESVVRQAVYEAVADELAHQARAARNEGQGH
ncbi:Uncharacterised protein [Delftia tsuruhatensis]|uniref:hypothetical protein n=1 Tax=Delftia tsuruhatensis TaxID=180282 RepID=UPI001E7A1006|nr:hypothetical protein [Delftia tsuruhatensis]CAB5673608.1 Uncharacterised protein [Delftia tsuruhatensis]CAC9683684.1 Uncharacterised protein [Delftia tsuruhatensis]